MNTTKLKLFLIDGNSYAYKAFYAVPHFKTSAGQPTNAIFGSARTLLKIIKDYKPDYLGVAFDSQNQLLDISNMRITKNIALKCLKN